MQDTKPKRAFLTFSLNSFWRGLLALNAFLFLSASLISCFVFLRFFDAKITLPEFANTYIKQETANLGAEISYEEAKISLNGEVSILKPSVKIIGDPFPIFEASQIKAKISVLELLFGGDLHLISASIEAGRLSESFTDIKKSAAISQIDLSLRKEGQWWILGYSNLQIGSVPVNVRGKINENADVKKIVGATKKEKKSSKQNITPAKISDYIDEVLSQIRTYEKYSNAFKSPQIDLNFELCSGGEFFARATFNSEEAQWSFGKTQLSANGLKLLIKLSSATMEKGTEIVARARKFRGTNLPSSEDVLLRAFLFFDANEGDVWFENVDFFADKIAWKNFAIDKVSAQKDFLSLDDWGNSWRFFAAFGKNRLGMEASFAKNGKASISLGCFANPMDIVKAEDFPEIAELKQFNFPEGLFLRGFINGNWKTQDFQASLALESDNCKVMNIPVDRVSAKVDFDSSTGIMLAHDIAVATEEGWKLRGEMLQNIKNYDYQIKIDGNIRPMAIAHFMEVWWTKVMRAFQFDGAFPYADVVVQGRWGAPENIWCYGFAKGQAARYEGVAFDDFSLDIWVNPTRITLRDISVSADERRAHAFIEWLYGKNGITTFQKQRLFLESNLNAKELCALGGDDAREVLDVVRFKNAPRITLNAVLQNPSLNTGEPDIFNVKAFSNGITQVEFATFENLSFFARSDKYNTNIDDMSFTFCSGSGTAEIDLKRVDAGMLFKGKARASAMAQKDFFEFLGSLSREDASDKSKKNSAQKDGAKSKEEKGVLADSKSELGKVDLDIHLSGDTRDFANISGAGFVTLTNEELVELNAFGLLSRALDAVRLPFGSFDLTYFSSPFEIAEGEIDFTNVEIGGPVMRIKGAAEYDFLNDKLQALLNIAPFAGVQTPLLSNIASVINPITSAATISVSGTLSNPKFGVKLTPSNIFKSDGKIIERMRDSL